MKPRPTSYVLRPTSGVASPESKVPSRPRIRPTSRAIPTALDAPRRGPSASAGGRRPPADSGRISLLLCALCALGGCLLLAGDWPHLGRDAARARATPETFGTAWAVDWTAPGDAPADASPAVADGVVIVADHLHVHAFAERDGAPLWSATVQGEIYASPTIVDGRVLVATTGFLYAFNLVTGDPAWPAVQTDHQTISSPVAVGSTFYLGAGFPERTVEARTLADGSLLDSGLVGQPVASSPAIDAGVLYVGAVDGDYHALDASTLDPVWSTPFSTGGEPSLSSPLVIGDSVFVLPGMSSSRLYRIDTAEADWATNWSVAVTDPSPPVGTRLTGWASPSSPIFAGGRVVFLLRFDYAVDADGDGQMDNAAGNEYAVAVDPATQTQSWKVFLGTVAVPTAADLPPLGTCPTPAGIQTASGAAVIAASSVSSTVRILNATTGATIASYAASDRTVASPAAANGRVFVLGRDGTLTAFDNAANHAPDRVTSGYSPPDAEVLYGSPAALSWDPAADPEDAPGTLSYVVRADTDGEVLLDWAFEGATAAGVTTVAFPAVAPDSQVTWRIRTVDPAGAQSEWSVPQDFWVLDPSGLPQPPSNFTALPGDAQVQLTWTASPTPDVVTYRLAVKVGAGAWGAYQDVGNVGLVTVGGLTNGVPCTFRLAARNAAGLDSPYVETSATPSFPVTVNGVPYPDVESAVLAALPGDVVQLGYGTFVLNAPLGLREGVDLIGQSPHETILVGLPGSTVIAVIAGSLPRGRIAMLTVTGGLVGIDTAGFAVAIENVVARDMDTGILVGAGSDALVKNDTLYNNASFGVYNNSTLAVVRNDIFDTNGTGLFCDPTASIAPTYCDFTGNGADEANTLPGAGNLLLPVVYTDLTAGDFRETVGSAAVDAGDPTDAFANEPAPNGSRINAGAYGNTAFAATSPQAAGGGGGGGGGGGCGAGEAGGSWVWALALLAALVAARRKVRSTMYE